MANFSNLSNKWIPRIPYDQETDGLLTAQSDEKGAEARRKKYMKAIVQAVRRLTRLIQVFIPGDLPEPSELQKLFYNSLVTHAIDMRTSAEAIKAKFPNDIKSHQLQKIQDFTKWETRFLRSMANNIETIEVERKAAVNLNEEPPLSKGLEDGSPKMMAICLGPKEWEGDEEVPHIAVGSTMAMWPKGSWLADRAGAKRKAQWTDQGHHTITEMANRYDALLKIKQAGDETEAARDQAVLELRRPESRGVMASGPLHVAQAFEPKTGKPRARCARSQHIFN
ncbi:MAG: hypothetical protein M1816_000709 [Peltula sp. TS41687]|nr:MAG: hypothetical protein M1816_000709 [Peltula sp. TS41687]